MRRPTRVLGSIVLIIVVALAIDYVRVRAKDRRAFHAISQCGGRSGSIPTWPLGTEYRITFPRALTSDELDQLGELNSLRGSVDVAFVDGGDEGLYVVIFDENYSERVRKFRPDALEKFNSSLHRHPLVGNDDLNILLLPSTSANVGLPPFRGGVQTTSTISIPFRFPFSSPMKRFVRTSYSLGSLPKVWDASA